MFPDETWDQVQRYARLEGVTLSEAISRAMNEVMPELDFPPLPRGSSMRLSGSVGYRAGRYFIPIEHAKQISEWMENGYSNPYLMSVIVTKGFEKMGEPK